MKFLCLVYLAPDALAGLSPEERADLDRRSMEYDRALERRGVYLAAAALQGVSQALTIRRRSGAPVMIDGPFAETKEVLAGFIYIDAPDQAAAVEIASGIPIGRYGAIELRPEMTFD